MNKNPKASENVAGCRFLIELAVAAVGVIATVVLAWPRLQPPVPPTTPTQTLIVEFEPSQTLEEEGTIENPLAENEGIVWQANFFGNKELKDPILFQGQIRGVRNGLDIDWGYGSPNGIVPTDYFSAIFTTEYDFLAGSYCFRVQVDDGARVFVDGVEILSEWHGYTPGAIFEASKELSMGSHILQLYYYDNILNAFLHFSWYRFEGKGCNSN